MGERMPEGVVAIDNIKYRKVRASFSSIRPRTFGKRRGYKNPNYAHTRIFFDDTTKTITIESPN